MFYVSTEDRFSSAHRLENYRGKCENLHGHNWKVMLTVRGPELDQTGMLLDFHELKALLKEVLSGLDHAYLNEAPILAGCNPTTEHIARAIYQRCAELLVEKAISGVEVYSVKAWETEGNAAEYAPGR
jgi:6-pyruvoyltetrahydropterin/6-carboxytetrahydropterin synthase